MPLVDSNVWLALAVEEHSLHSAAQVWFAPRKPRTALFCRSTQQSFLRLLTTKAVFAPFGSPPLTNREAWTVFEDLQADRRVSWATEPDDLDVIWRAFASDPISSPKLWMDAYLAAFSIAGNHQFVTTDKGFRQFDGLDLLLLSGP